MSKVVPPLAIPTQSSHPYPMKPSTIQIIETVLKSDDTITERHRHSIVLALQDRQNETDHTPLSGPLLIRAGQAAKLLGLSRTTLWRMTKENTLKKITIRQGSGRYRVQDIMELAREGTNRESGDISGNQGGH